VRCFTNAVVAEIIGVKIFSAEYPAGSKTRSDSSDDFVLDFNLNRRCLARGLINSDLINEASRQRRRSGGSCSDGGFHCHSFVVIYLVADPAPAAFCLT
jgi:hypothetical protein